MKKFLFLTVYSLCAIKSVYAQLPSSSSMHSTTTPSSTIEPLKPLEHKKAPPPSKAPTLPPPIKSPSLHLQEATYLHPGILVNLNGRWEGSDHLLNLSNQIGIYVSIIKPEQETIDITKEEILKEVDAIFQQAGIRTDNLVQQGRPPLPAFEIEIFIYPIERGFSACCEGRLFESVTLDRFKMDPNMAFQAITWEKQSLIVSPKNQLKEQLIHVSKEIATAFAERFSLYERMKRSAGYR